MPKIPSKPRWEQRKVRIELDSSRSVEVDAACLGNLAVHPDVENQDLWAVMHLPTTRWIVLVKTLDDAMLAATEMARCPELSLKSLSLVRERTPEWCRRWIDAIKRELCYVDPRPYKKQYSQSVAKV